MLDAEAVLKMIVQITRIYPSWGKKFVILLWDTLYIDILKT